MKGREVLMGQYAGREAAALLMNGALEDLLIEAPAGIPVLGAIYRAIPQRPVKGLGGIFLRLPDGTAFLRQSKGIAPGRPLLVQVSGYAEAGKAAPVTTRLSLKGRTVVVTPEAPGRNVSRRIAEGEMRERLLAIAEEAHLPENAGLVIRSEAADAAEEAVAQEIAELAGLADRILADVAGGPELLLGGPRPHEVAWRDWGAVDLPKDRENAFVERGLDEAVDSLLSPEVAFSTGGRMTIEPTRALVAVDVDTGSDTSPAATLKANIVAARALPRELRCRGLGGQITVDFAPIPRRDRQRIEQALTAALRHDPIETVVAGWTALSHLELRRRRSRLPLAVCLK